MQQRSEAQALQDRSLQQRPEAQALQDRSLQQRLEAQVLPDRPLQQRPEAQALHDRPLQQRSEAQATQDRLPQQRPEAQNDRDVPLSALEELTGAVAAPAPLQALTPGTRLQIRIDGQLRDVVVNESGGLEAGPAQFYIGSLRHASPPGARGGSVPRAPTTTPPSTPKIGTSPGLSSTPGGTPVPPGPAPTSPRGAHSPVPVKPEEPSRHITELPSLAEPKQRSQGAVLAGDWLAAVAPLMRQLSSGAQTWWAQNVKEAEEHYERWLQATPQQRLQVKASALVKSFETGKFCLVEQRGVQLLLKAVPEAFRTDLIATRTLAVNPIIFAILCRWQPGGKLERAQVLDFLVRPEAASSVEDTVEGIRKWRRMVLRAAELGAVLPDSSLLLKGLDTLTQPCLSEHHVVAFRVAAYRNDTGVDFAPTQDKVSELAEYLLAEYESLSIQEDPKQQAPKRQRAAAAKSTAAKAEAKPGSDGQASAPPGVPAKAASAATPADKKICRFWGTSLGCKKAASCPDHHDRTLLKGARRCWACSSDQHLKPDCPWGPHEGSAPPTGGKAAEANTKDHKGLKGSGKGGKAKKGDADAKLQKAKEQSAEDVTADSTAAPAPSAAELLKEATEVIRSLKLKALVLKVQHGNSVCEDVKNAAEAVCGTGLLDTGASTSMRQAKPGELDEECELRTVNLAIGTVKLFVNSGGTLLSEEDIDPLVSVADLVEMGCKLSWSGNECVLWHPDRGTIRPSTLNKCPEVSRDLALELIADIEAHRQAQRIMIRALRDEAESLSIRDAAVLQNKLCSSARAGLKVGALMYSWLCHKFEGTPVGLLDNLALRSNCATDGALVKWNRRVRRACERDGAFVAVGQPKAVKDAAKPCVVLEVDLV